MKDFISLSQFWPKIAPRSQLERDSPAGAKVRPFQFDSRWLKNYGYAERALPGHRSLPKTLVLLAACILVIIGGAALLFERVDVRMGSHQPDHPRVRFM